MGEEPTPTALSNRTNISLFIPYGVSEQIEGYVILLDSCMGMTSLPEVKQGVSRHDITSTAMS